MCEETRVLTLAERIDRERQRRRQARSGKILFGKLLLVVVTLASFTAGFAWNTQKASAPTTQLTYAELKRAEDDYGPEFREAYKKNYKKPTPVRRMTVEITAYLPMDPHQSSMTGLARDGNPAIPWRTAAVDRSVIPFYSEIYVPGIGWFLAHDTGGAIKGNRVDICVDDKAWAMQWGRRTVEVLIAEPTE